MKMQFHFLAISLLFITVVTSCKKNNSSDPEEVKPVVVLPDGAKEGVVFSNSGTSATFTLYAPGKNSVALIGDFNDWSVNAAKMNRTSDGNYFWVKIDNLNPDTEYAYQFLVNDNLKVADPYCEKILDPVNDVYINQATYPNLKAYPTGKTTGIVSVMQASQVAYTWKNSSFTRPAKNNLVIYELLVRDFTTEHTYNSTLQKLDYLVSLGVNAIELMPVNEFEGNSSWGYNPSFYFAADKYYGTKNDLKKFIDECHGRGIAVILDVVLNHSFSQSPMVQLYYDGSKPTSNSPWYNTDAKHPHNVGFDFNHESAATKLFSKNVMKFWMQEYKVDGFRFDLSKGFTQKQSTDDNGFSAYDASRVNIWKEYNNYIKSIDANNFYVILEHFADATEEKALADEGMMLWNNLNYNMNEATMGWLTNSNFQWGFYANHNLAKSENLVNYIESHDEERLNYKNINFGNVVPGYSVKDPTTALKRQQMAAAFMFAIPGPKMIWQFGELGYDVSIDFNGRTGEKPIRWNYYVDTNRKELYNTYAKLAKLKKLNSIFNATTNSYSLASGIKYIKLTEGSNTVVVVGNFDVVSQSANIDFGSSGTWYDALGGSITLSSNSYNRSLAPGEYHIYSKQVLIP